MSLNTSVALRLMLPLLVVATSSITLAKAANEKSLWVQAAWQAVQAGPDTKTAVVAHWPANTIVSMGEKKGDWCQAKAENGEAGFVPCTVLGETALTLEVLYARWPDKSTRDDEKLAFWVAPSVARFTQAGANFNYRALSAQQQAEEERTQKPVRFPIAEFDAMKRRLSQNVLPRIEQEVNRIDARSFASLGPTPPWNSSNADWLKRWLSPAMLPPAKPSMFRQHGDVLVWGEGSSDAIAALLGQPSRIRFVGKPEWVVGHHDQGVVGIWDIGGVESRYARSVPLVAISRSGLIEARLVTGTESSGYSYDEGCAEGYPTLETGELLPGWPRVKTDRLVALYLPALPATKKVDVLTRRKQAPIPESDISDTPPRKLSDVMVHSFDLDQDGIADVSVMEVPETTMATTGEPTLYFFLNVAGRWWYAGQEYSAFCT